MRRVTEGPDTGERLVEPDLAAVVAALSWSWRAAQAAGRPDTARAIFTAYLLVADLVELHDLPEVER